MAARRARAFYVFVEMRAPLRLMPPWTREQFARIRQIEGDLHVRVFGEEMARVNLEMSEAERHRYLQWMRELAAKKGLRPRGAPREDLEKVKDSVPESAMPLRESWEGLSSAAISHLMGP
jgi:hypothetical protein